MTAAVGPYAVEEGMVDVVEPVTCVHMLNRNTGKTYDLSTPPIIAVKLVGTPAPGVRPSGCSFGSDRGNLSESF